MKGCVLMTGLCPEEPLYLQTIYENMVKPNNLDVFVHVKVGDSKKCEKYFSSIFGHHLKYFKLFNDDKQYIRQRDLMYNVIISRYNLMVDKYGYEDVKKVLDDIDYENVIYHPSKKYWEEDTFVKKHGIMFTHVDQYGRLSYACEELKRHIYENDLEYDYIWRWRPDFKCLNKFDITQMVPLKDREIYVIPETQWSYAVYEFLIARPDDFFRINTQFLWDMYIYIPPEVFPHTLAPEIQIGQYIRVNRYTTFKLEIAYKVTYPEEYTKTYVFQMTNPLKSKIPHKITDFPLNKENLEEDVSKLSGNKLNLSENIETLVLILLTGVYSITLFFIYVFQRRKQRMRAHYY